MNLEKEITKSNEYDAQKFDWRMPAKDITSSMGALSWPQAQLMFGDLEHTGVITDGRASLEYDDWSLGQLCQRVGIPTSYMKQCPHDLRDINLNYWLSKSEKNFLVRGIDTRARALLSDRYVPISNTSVLSAVSDVVDVDLPYTCTVNPDYIYLKILAANTPDGMFAAGVVITNGEIGDYALRVSPFVQRHSCTNSIVFNDGGLYIRHVSEFSSAYLHASIKEHTGKALGVSADYVNRVIAADLVEIPDISKLIDSICVLRGYNSEVRDKIMIGTEGKSTQQAVANGLSWAAHEVQDHRMTIELEGAAGAYLMGRIQVPVEIDE